MSSKTTKRSPQSRPSARNRLATKPVARSAAQPKAKTKAQADPLGTVRPVRNPLAEPEAVSIARPATDISDVAPTIRSIDFSWEKGQPPNLIIEVVGESPRGPWTHAELVPRHYLVPPADGIWEFDLCGLRGDGIGILPFRIPVSFYWARFPEGNPAYRGVRICGKGKGIAEKLFDGSVPPGTPAGPGAAYTKFLVPLPTKGSVLYRAGEWELYVFFRAVGSRSEGPHGVLLKAGSLVRHEEEELSTDLGVLRNFAPGNSWDPSGWLFADYRPSSRDFFGPK